VFVPGGVRGYADWDCRRVRPIGLARVPVGFVGWQAGPPALEADALMPRLLVAVELPAATDDRSSN
jgi:hypothetical protein